MNIRAARFVRGPRRQVITVIAAFILTLSLIVVSDRMDPQATVGGSEGDPAWIPLNLDQLQEPSEFQAPTSRIQLPPAEMSVDEAADVALDLYPEAEVLRVDFYAGERTRLARVDLSNGVAVHLTLDNGTVFKLERA